MDGGVAAPMTNCSFVAHHGIRTGSGAASAESGNPYCVHDDREHGRITALPGAKNHCQWSAFTVTGMVDLGAQTAPGAADGVVRRLSKQFLVIREFPLWRGEGSSRAGGLG